MCLLVFRKEWLDPGTESRGIKGEAQFPEGSVEPVIMIRGPPVAPKVETGDADPAVGTDQKPGATGISGRKMTFLIVGIETVNQERSAVLGEAQAG